MILQVDYPEQWERRIEVSLLNVPCVLEVLTLDPFHIFTSYTKWDKTSWTDSILQLSNQKTIAQKNRERPDKR